jgi:choline dehydrogenase-like flavoprotein
VTQITRELRTDCVVVGSGAGGAVTAYYAARAGHQVTIIERGRWVRPEDMPPGEMEAFATLYKDGAAQMNSAVTMALLQGSCVGGSTVLANVVCFRLPETVRQAYASFGLELPRSELDASYERVESVLNVHETREELLNPVAFKLERGMRSLGFEPKRFRHAVQDCVGCGECNLGCRYGAKMDASRTWLPMAVERGAEVLTQTEAVQLEVTRGRVTGLICRDLSSGEGLRVVADRYVLSGGAINTPEILLRSRILPQRAGRRMSLNSGAMMVAEYPEPVDAFDGIQMGVYLEHERYTIEQLHNPYLSFCMSQPIWLDRLRDQRPDHYRYLTSCGVLTPTESVGRVFLHPLRKLLPSLFQRAEIKFRLPDTDRRTMVDGYKQLARIYLASGAKHVYAPTHHRVAISSPDEVNMLDEALHDASAIAGLGSAHPQGGAALGDDPRRDVVGPDYRVYGHENLYVMDASIFPTSMGVNPMLTIMAVADYASQFIVGERPPAVIEEGPAFAARQSCAALS